MNDNEEVYSEFIHYNKNNKNDKNEHKLPPKICGILQTHDGLHRCFINLDHAINIIKENIRWLKEKIHQVREEKDERSLYDDWLGNPWNFCTIEDIIKAKAMMFSDEEISILLRNVTIIKGALNYILKNIRGRAEEELKDAPLHQ